MLLRFFFQRKMSTRSLQRLAMIRIFDRFANGKQVPDPASSDRWKSGMELGKKKKKVIPQERCGICKAKGHRRDSRICLQGRLIGMGDDPLAVPAHAEEEGTLAIAQGQGEVHSSEENASEDDDNTGAGSDSA